MLGYVFEFRVCVRTLCTAYECMRVYVCMCGPETELIELGHHCQHQCQPLSTPTTAPLAATSAYISVTFADSTRMEAIQASVRMPLQSCALLCTPMLTDWLGRTWRQLAWSGLAHHGFPWFTTLACIDHWTGDYCRPICPRTTWQQQQELSIMQLESGKHSAKPDSKRELVLRSLQVIYKHFN